MAIKRRQTIIIIVTTHSKHRTRIMLIHIFLGRNKSWNDSYGGRNSKNGIITPRYSLASNKFAKLVKIQKVTP